MPKFTNPLDHVKIAAPCSAEWNEMHGSAQVRFCRDCSFNVYNLSALTQEEAERLLLEREGRFCVRFYRRKDGTILTQNCPAGLRAIKRRLERTATALLSACLTFCVGFDLAQAVGKFYEPFSIEEIVENDSELFHSSATGVQEEYLVEEGRAVIPPDSNRNKNQNHRGIEMGQIPGRTLR